MGTLRAVGRQTVASVIGKCTKGPPPEFGAPKSLLAHRVQPLFEDFGPQHWYLAWIFETGSLHELQIILWMVGPYMGAGFT